MKNIFVFVLNWFVLVSLVKAVEIPYEGMYSVYIEQNGKKLDINQEGEVLVQRKPFVFVYSFSREDQAAYTSVFTSHEVMCNVYSNSMHCVGNPDLLLGGALGLGLNGSGMAEPYMPTQELFVLDCSKPSARWGMQVWSEDTGRFDVFVQSGENQWVGRKIITKINLMHDGKPAFADYSFNYLYVVTMGSCSIETSSVANKLDERGYCKPVMLNQCFVIKFVD